MTSCIATTSCIPTVLALLLIGCSGGAVDGGSGGAAGGGASGGTGGLDAGLDPDAALAECVSEAGVRICGAEAGCFEDGSSCKCLRGWGLSKDPDPIPGFSVCNDVFDIIPIRPCGYCFDGEVCARLPTTPFCVPEDLGASLWARGAGDQVLYADYTPYTGEPLPRPSECPAPVADVTLCGGSCGGCGPEYFCTGRSPTHPYGICLDLSVFSCNNGEDCAQGEACLRLSDGPDALDPLILYPSLCVSQADCPLYESAIPGGITCG